MGRRTTVENGQKFGRWTVIDNTPIVRNTHRYVKCRCECGKEQLVASADLVHGRTKSCKHCVALNRRILIPVGTQSKNWTITGNTKMSKSQNLLYEVQCTCGNHRWMTASEFHNPGKSNMCQKCAGVLRGEKRHLEDSYEELYQTKYYKMKKQAERRHYKFSLTKEYLWNLYLQQNKTCAITGDPLPNLSKASLDRIDSSIGYIEGNVQWVSKQANLSKHVMSMTELYEFCRKVLDHANQQPSQPLTKLEGSETNS